ncbi:MAG: hypothetical protein R3F14_27220 [Polyangiaceae bacterium]
MDDSAAPPGPADGASAPVGAAPDAGPAARTQEDGPEFEVGLVALDEGRWAGRGARRWGEGSAGPSALSDTVALSGGAGAVLGAVSAPGGGAVVVPDAGAVVAPEVGPLVVPEAGPVVVPEVGPVVVPEVGPVVAPAVRSSRDVSWVPSTWFLTVSAGLIAVAGSGRASCGRCGRWRGRTCGGRGRSWSSSRGT